MMLLPMIFTNGRLIFPERVAEGLSLRVEGGKIVALGREIPFDGEEVIDLEGNFLAPGFIDLHEENPRHRRRWLERQDDDLAGGKAPEV